MFQIREVGKFKSLGVFLGSRELATVGGPGEALRLTVPAAELAPALAMAASVSRSVTSPFLDLRIKAALEGEHPPSSVAMEVRVVGNKPVVERVQIGEDWYERLTAPALK